MNTIAKTTCLLLLCAMPCMAPAQTPTPVVAPTPPVTTSPDRERTVVENIALYDEHSKLSAAIEAAGLADALGALGPLTIFAPTDSAFSSTVNVTYSELLAPENRGKLAELLRYHVVPGLLDFATLDAKIQAGGGKAKLGTVQGSLLTVQRDGEDIIVTDATNHSARIIRADLYQRNGVVQVVDRVLMHQVE
jgi:uncharacterized surface protein with fasciclin (FAS1) repeats